MKCKLGSLGSDNWNVKTINWKLGNGKLENWKRGNVKLENLTCEFWNWNFDNSKIPAPLNIPTPTPAPDHLLGGHNEHNGMSVEWAWGERMNLIS